MADEAGKPGLDPAVAYQQAVEAFGAAVERMQKGDFQKAADAFAKIESENTEEPVLAERARAYRHICERRTAPPAEAPRTADEQFLHGVFALNDGRLDESIGLLDASLSSNPASAKAFYARASAYALKGNTDAAVADLRQCIAIDPATRFHAANDPDFEKIREEPAFIDIIEPTAQGA